MPKSEHKYGQPVPEDQRRPLAEIIEELRPHPNLVGATEYYLGYIAEIRQRYPKAPILKFKPKTERAKALAEKRIAEGSICGARSKTTGEPCLGQPVRGGNGRCHMHGGTLSKPENRAKMARPGNVNGVTHGFYSKALSDSEKELLEIVQVGNLDEEIKVAKIKLERYLSAMSNPDLESVLDGELEIISRREAAMQKALAGRNAQKLEVKVKTPNYSELAQRQMGIIAKLELARDALIKSARESQENEAPTEIKVTIRRSTKPDPVPEEDEDE